MVQRRSSTGTLRSGVGAARYRTRYGWPQSHTPGNPAALRVAPQDEHSRDQGTAVTYGCLVGAQHAAPLRHDRLAPRAHTRACNRSRIRSASLLENPGSDAISAGVAARTLLARARGPRRPPPPPPRRAAARGARRAAPPPPRIPPGGGGASPPRRPAAPNGAPPLPPPPKPPRGARPGF